LNRFDEVGAGTMIIIKHRDRHADDRRQATKSGRALMTIMRVRGSAGR